MGLRNHLGYRHGRSRLQVIILENVCANVFLFTLGWMNVSWCVDLTKVKIGFAIDRNVFGYADVFGQGALVDERRC